MSIEVAPFTMPRLHVEADAEISENFSAVRVNNGLVLDTVGGNALRPFGPDDVLNVILRHRKLSASLAAAYDPAAAAIEMWLHPDALSVPNFFSFNYAFGHELKHFIDDHNHGLLAEMYKFARNERLKMGAAALGAGLSIYAGRKRLLPVYGSAALAVVNAATSVRKAWEIDQIEYGRTELRRSLYERQPWEKRANEFARQHAHLPFIEVEYEPAEIPALK